MAGVQQLSRVTDFRDTQEQTDRRRPGRQTVAPQLVHLVRSVAEEESEQDALVPMRGILVASALSAPIYAGLYIALKFLVS